jgi:hypothetical protein
VLVAAYVAALGAMVGARGLHISADRYFLILLAPALALGVGRRYVRDFGPFIAAMIAFEFLRGGAAALNDELGRGAFYVPMIDVDRVLGLGRLPTEIVQGWFWTGHVSAFDHLVGYFDHVHFFVPPTLLFLIWLDRREHFYRCAIALVSTSLAGAIAFLAFPAAPPWMAARDGVGDVSITYIGRLESAANGLPHGASWIASQIPANYVAAVPSLHAAYALLTVLMAWSWRRRVGIALLPYPLVMWFAIVYLGDHYVADVLVGVAFALVAWWTTGRLVRPDGPLVRLRGPFPSTMGTARTFGEHTT